VAYLFIYLGFNVAYNVIVWCYISYKLVNSNHKSSGYHSIWGMMDSF